MTSTPPHLASFGGCLNAAVIGAAGGIGGGFVEQLANAPAIKRLYALSRSRPVLIPSAAQWHQIDIQNEASVAAAAAAIGESGPLDLVVVATGILHDDGGLTPEKTWRALDGDAFAKIFAVNTIGPALVAKHFLPVLARDRKAVFAALSARVGSISDNQLGGWHAYRASKAALNMLIRTFAIELAYRNPSALCVGLHPGTVDTNLSAPFQGNVPDGKLFTPATAAASLLNVIDSLNESDSGRLFAWDGLPIDW